MRLGSFCTGIGGLDLAVADHYQATPEWHCEVDPAASRVLERWFPGVPNLGDLTALDWSTVPGVDVICAGYPCQPFSQAGARKGTSDDRHLWPYIADAVRHLRPRVVVLENVAGHLSLGFGDVLGDLAEAGFDAEWGVFRASDVGAPHRRERLFVVAYAHGMVGQTPEPCGGGRGAVAEPEAVPGAFGLLGGPVADTDCDGLGRLEGPPAGRHAVRADVGGDVDGRRDWGRYRAAVERWEHTLGRPAPDPLDDGRLSPRFVEWMMGYPDGWTEGEARSARLRMLGNAVVRQQAALGLDELAPVAVPA